MNYKIYYNLSRYYAETGEPLSADVQAYRKKLSDIEALDLSDEKIQERFPEEFWKFAIVFNINLFPADLKYTEDVIKKDEVFNEINFDYIPGLSASQKHNLSIKKLSCLDYFYNDKECPAQLKKILDISINRIKMDMPANEPYPLHYFVLNVLRRNHGKEESNKNEVQPKKSGHAFTTEVLLNKLKEQSGKNKKSENAFTTEALLSKLKEKSQI